MTASQATAASVKTRKLAARVEGTAGAACSIMQPQAAEL